jgi:hypothetical protein
MTIIYLLLAYALPLPLLYGCVHYHIFDDVQDPLTRLLYIGATSLAPSAVLMIFVLKRIVQFALKLIVFAGILYGLNHFGLLGQTAAPQGTP